MSYIVEFAVLLLYLNVIFIFIETWLNDSAFGTPILENVFNFKKKLNHAGRIIFLPILYILFPLFALGILVVKITENSEILKGIFGSIFFKKSEMVDK